MELPFTKMHGLGNDFVVVNGMERPVSLKAEQVRRIADRRRGVGCDQLLLLAPPRNEQADVLLTVFNADGEEAEQCGNGMRCVAALLRERGLARGAGVTAETGAGLTRACFQEDGMIKVNMGRPRFESPLRRALELGGTRVEAAVLSLGNPHAVLFVADLEQAPVGELGPQAQQHPLFPRGVNVGFAQVLDQARIGLRVYERGVGETPACGSGACAAAVAGIRTQNLAPDLEVALQGGRLAVSWAGADAPVWMTGPATTVYEGSIAL